MADPGITNIALRLPDGLAKWATTYAKVRGVSRNQILIAAVEHLKDESSRGVPDVGEPVPAPAAPDGETEFQRDAREQAALQNPTGPGVGVCPQSPGGHEWGLVDGATRCVHCDIPGAEFLDAATEQRTRLFMQVRAPKSVREGKAAK